MSVSHLGQASTARWLLLLGAAAFAGCLESDDRFGEGRYAIAQPGPWDIPPETLAIGDEQDVLYTDAGPWLGEASCSGGPTVGAEILSDYLLTYFPQIETIGGYSCRAIVGDSSSASVHSTGRALDIMLPLATGDADNDLGDPIGNWLIEHAEEIGIQFVIWDRYTWMAEREVGEKGRDYGGPNPHIDHLHVELSVEGGMGQTAFFTGDRAPPDVPPCGVIESDGGIVDDIDPCVQVFGPAEYWRVADDIGYDDRLLWTNAFQADEPSNWARWSLFFEESGTYDVEVYAEPGFAAHKSAHYRVNAADEASDVFVDLSASKSGWISLGEHRFAAGGGQSLELFDNSSDAVGEDAHITVDAVRLRRTGRVGGLPGCSSGSGAGGNPLWVLAALCLAIRRRARS